MYNILTINIHYTHIQYILYFINMPIYILNILYLIYYLYIFV